MPKRVRFKPDSDLEEVRIIENRESHPHRHRHRREQQQPQQQQPQQQQPQQQQPQQQQPQRGRQQHSSRQESAQFPNNQTIAIQNQNLEGVPPLFRCTSGEEIGRVIKTGKGAIEDLFRGYNALQWYCDAKTASPGIIRELLRRGIDINAVDQRPSKHRPIVRHTALGFACRNANQKAVRTLLRHGADPGGLARSARYTELPKQDSRGGMIVYPSPLQELLGQPTHGPRPGKCPWTYHLSETDDKEDSYPGAGDLEIAPTFRALVRSSKSKDRHVCQECAADYHIWEPWPETEEEKASARERRRSNFRSQILRLGNRLLACVRLLLAYDPPAVLPLPQCDDPRIWSALDCFQETFWRFYFPLVVCERAGNPADKAFPASPGRLPHPIWQPVFSAYGDICDMLLEDVGYESKSKRNSKSKSKSKSGRERAAVGQDRLISLIAEHPELSSFKQGEYFDVDSELGRLMSKGASIY
ncbi:hypothetical protein F5Y14DRAFT_461703 [Nemania sp. NC0429]|nr:hypothetical protein F5Y14DRAFT_461703 [Nemania sp. NC0429]